MSSIKTAIQLTNMGGAPTKVWNMSVTFILMKFGKTGWISISAAIDAK